MSLPEELLADVDLDQVYADAEKDGEEATKAENAPALTPYFARDFIPGDATEQTPEQQAFLRTAPMPSVETGPRDFIPQGEAPKDSTFEEKSRVAEEAAMRWQEQYTARMEEKAAKDVAEWNEAKLVSYMESLGLTDRQIYLRAEAADKARPGIFARFGQPEGSDESESEHADEEAPAERDEPVAEVEDSADGDTADAEVAETVEAPKAKTKTVRKNKE